MAAKTANGGFLSSLLLSWPPWASRTVVEVGECASLGSQSERVSRVAEGERYQFPGRNRRGGLFRCSQQLEAGDRQGLPPGSPRLHSSYYSSAHSVF